MFNMITTYPFIRKVGILLLSLQITAPIFSDEKDTTSLTSIIPNDQTIYLEAHNIHELIHSMFSFFSAVHGNSSKEQDEFEWKHLNLLIANNFGLSFYEPDLLSFGIDTHKSVFITMNITNLKQTTMYLRSKNSLNTYLALKKYYHPKHNISNEYLSNNTTDIGVHEIKKNTTFKVQRNLKTIYVSHIDSSNTVIISINKEILIPTHAASLQQSSFYMLGKEYTNHLDSNSKLKIFINPQKIDLLSSKFKFLTAIFKDSKNQLSNSNINTIAGTLGIHKQNLIINIKAFFTHNFFQDKVISFPIGISNKNTSENTFEPLSIESSELEHLLYSKIFLDASNTVDIINYFIPNLNHKKILFEKEGEVNLNKELSTLFSGNTNLIINNIPRGFNIVNMEDWQPILALQTYGDTLKIQNLIEKWCSFLKKYDHKTEIIKHSSTSWEILYPIIDIYAENSLDLKKSLFITFLEKEVIISTKNINPDGKNIFGSKKQIVDKYLNESLDKSINFILGLDLKKIYDRILNSRFSLLLHEFVMYVENLDTLSVYCQYKENWYGVEINLKLK